MSAKTTIKLSGTWPLVICVTFFAAQVTNSLLWSFMQQTETLVPSYLDSHLQVFSNNKIDMTLPDEFSASDSLVPKPNPFHLRLVAGNQCMQIQHNFTF